MYFLSSSFSFSFSVLRLFKHFNFDYDQGKIPTTYSILEIRLPSAFLDSQNLFAFVDFQVVFPAQYSLNILNACQNVFQVVSHLSIIIPFRIFACLSASIFTFSYNNLSALAFSSAI
jgi:hypothetical protein